MNKDTEDKSNIYVFWEEETKRGKKHNLSSEVLPFSFEFVFKFFFPLDVSFTQKGNRWYPVIKMTYLMVSIKSLK